MKTENKKELINKYLNGNISNDEEITLTKWLLENDVNFQNFLIQRNEFEKDIKTDFQTEMAWNRFSARITESKRIDKNKHRSLFSNILKYAAFFIGIIGLSYFMVNEKIFDANESSLIIAEETITLKLDDGTIKKINEKGESQIVDSKGEVLVSQKGEQLNYQNERAIEELVYNELNVPYGKKIEILLSDGTKVHLNAGSTFRYPVKFLDGKEREVFLNGEAFFDVTKNKENSFIVNVGELDVRVFGTKFNVSSYKEDKSINTVLVEGAVGLYNSNDEFNQENGAMLKPGYLGAWDKSAKEISMDKVDTNTYTSWIEGKLIFKDTPFEIIRKKLERHYNVTIINNNIDLDARTYRAKFDIESIEQVLETLKKNYDIEYTIENNQIIIN